jgi:hypothetical protein
MDNRSSSGKPYRGTATYGKVVAVSAGTCLTGTATIANGFINDVKWAIGQIVTLPDVPGHGNSSRNAKNMAFRRRNARPFSYTLS